jgi:putative transposase
MADPLEAAFHRRQRPVSRRWGRDETSIFLLTSQWDRAAALCFLTKAINCHGIPEPIPTAQRAANAAAMATDNIGYGTTMAIRQVKCLNAVVEQDHRAVPPMTYPMLVCKSMEAAPCTRGASNVCTGGGRASGQAGTSQGLTPAGQFCAPAA